MGQFAVHVKRVLERFITNNSGSAIDSSESDRTALESQNLEQIRALQRPYAEQRDVADKLAGVYMELYRGSFVLNFLLGAFAVLFALFSYFNPVNESAWLFCEITALLLIAINYLADRWWHWHERAIDYRFLAEYFRHMVSLAPLVRVTPLTRMPVHNKYGDPDATWMNWYFRSIVRNVGLVGSSTMNTVKSPQMLALNAGYVDAVRQLLQKEWLDDQYNYHAHVAHRFRFIGNIVRLFTIALFVVTIGACFVHLYHITFSHEDVVSTVASLSHWRQGALLTILVAVLPAFLAAFHGLSKQGEFERLTERSEAMADHLGHIGKRFANMTYDEHHACAVTMGRRAVDISRMMLEEMLEWRVIYLAHATELT